MHTGIMPPNCEVLSYGQKLWTQVRAKYETEWAAADTVERKLLEKRMAEEVEAAVKARFPKSLDENSNAINVLW